MEIPDELGRIICINEGSSVYVNKDMDLHTKAAIKYTHGSQSVSAHNINKRAWAADDIHKQGFMTIQVKSEMKNANSNIINGDQGGDEETIATFLTAAGQQLALYAVEDSEEIFAVAVYDENGEPPTNFQFLMKADVERLIGEGAVRTVKKPTQIKKQLLTTQPPIFFSKMECVQQIPIKRKDKGVSMNDQRVQRKEKALAWKQPSMLMQESDFNLNMKGVAKIMYTSTSKDSENVTYVMMDDCSLNIENCEKEIECDSEIVEQSTVQYILFEGDDSDSELTFDEIQTTLRNLKSSERKPTARKSLSKRPSIEHNHANSEKHIENSSTQNNNCVMANHTASSLAEKQLMADRQELINTLSDSPTSLNMEDTKVGLFKEPPDYSSTETGQVQLKAKRSRKQQLISVNREDSEIIIQPAALLTEEDNIKKIGKRRRKIVSRSGYHRNNEPKRIKKMKRKEVEVIEIDIEEDETTSQSKKDIVEITLDDSKDKYSSDKENEIIMVRDSDDESPQSDAKLTRLQCHHCFRNFRQQRVLETHIRMCPKSPANIIKFNEQKLKNANRASNSVKKEYACKVCQEKFDVVVALARHVRSEHSQRKRRRYSKSPVESVSKSESELEKENLEQATKKPSDEAQKSQLQVIKKIKKKKRNQQSHRSWEVKKLNCSDCGRWFPSAALLRAHYLQHETKQSEQVRRCQVCKKMIKSKLLYIRHLKMHNNRRRSSKPVSSIQKKLHTTRSVTRKITSLRKRGRPRKL